MGLYFDSGNCFIFGHIVKEFPELFLILQKLSDGNSKKVFTPTVSFVSLAVPTCISLFFRICSLSLHLRRQTWKFIQSIPSRKELLIWINFSLWSMKVLSKFLLSKCQEFDLFVLILRPDQTLWAQLSTLANVFSSLFLVVS